jgi:hypothetical protein
MARLFVERGFEVLTAHFFVAGSPNRRRREIAERVDRRNDVLAEKNEAPGRPDDFVNKNRPKWIPTHFFVKIKTT